MEKVMCLPFLVHLPPVLVQPSDFRMLAALAASPAGGRSLLRPGATKSLSTGSRRPPDEVAGGSYDVSACTESCWRLMPRLMALRTAGSFRGALGVLNTRLTTLVSAENGALAR